jgi:hypothetical protein
MGLQAYRDNRPAEDIAESEEPIVGYRAIGAVRGWCGHTHRTGDAAQECADHDHRSLQHSWGSDGYSDRIVAEVTRCEDADVHSIFPHLHLRPWEGS